MVSNQIYPQKAFINALTNAQNAVATFTADHDFTLGEIVSFRVTANFGMYEINEKRGRVIATTSDTITVDIDTTDWTAFDYSNLDAAGTTPPTCVPVGGGKIPVTQSAISKVEPVATNQQAAFDNRKV